MFVSKLFVLVTLASPLVAGAFVVHHHHSKQVALRGLVSSTARFAYLKDDDDYEAITTKSVPQKRVDGDGPSEFLASLRNFDITTLTNYFDDYRKNLSGGTVGERGEAYAFAQIFCVLCIIGGGIPFVGDFLFLLLGPVLLTVGAAVLVVSLKDMGPSLNFWPKPATSPNAKLITDGLFDKMRHPTYSGLLATCAGLSIVSGSATRLLLTAVLWFILDIKADYEEDELMKVYPEYSQYKAKVTGKFFPQEIMDAMPWNIKDI